MSLAKSSTIQLVIALTDALRHQDYPQAHILAKEIDRRMQLVFYTEYVAYRESIA